MEENEKQNLYTYDELDHGPFKVNIQYTKKFGATATAFISDLVVGQDLSKHGFKECKIIRVSRNVVTVTLKTPKAANDLIAYDGLKEKYRVYVIRAFVFVDGFFSCPSELEFDGEDGVEAAIRRANSNLKVEKVKRMFPKPENNTDNQQVRKFYNVAVSFRMKKLPERIALLNTFRRIIPFNSGPKFCTTCGFYGHDISQCNHANQPVCDNCFQKGHKTCDKTFCKHCKSTEHKANSDKCKEKMRQGKISKIMAENNIGFNMAKRVLLNKAKPPNRSDQKSFPKLPKTTRIAQNPQNVNTPKNQTVEQFFTPFQTVTPTTSINNKRRRGAASKPNAYQKNKNDFNPDLFNPSINKASFADVTKRSFQNAKIEITEETFNEFQKFVLSRMAQMLSQLAQEFVTEKSAQQDVKTVDISSDMEVDKITPPPKKTFIVGTNNYFSPTQ